MSSPSLLPTDSPPHKCSSLQLSSKDDPNHKALGILLSSQHESFENLLPFALSLLDFSLLVQAFRNIVLSQFLSCTHLY